MKLAAEPRTRLGIFAAAFVFHAVVALAQAMAAKIPLSALGVYFDGHLYIEIAKSFPLPYSELGFDYLGHAPLYPALIALVDVCTPSAWVDWGLAALIAAWIPAALSAVVFYEICRALDAPPLAGAALFVVANPRWVAIASTAHSETLAMLFLLLCVLAYLRDELQLCVALLALAALTRFPLILVGGPIALGFLFARRRFDVKTVAWLAVPLVALGLFHIYLALRVPGFEGVWEAHKVHWPVQWTWPFANLVEFIDPGGWPWFLYCLTYGTLALGFVAVVKGFRLNDRVLWMLPSWIAVLLVFHASLGGLGATGAFSYTRMVVMAWPAILVLLWMGTGWRVPWPAAATLCLALGAAGIATATILASAAVYKQTGRPYIRQEIELLRTDEPHWVDFRQMIRRHRDAGTLR